MRTPRKPKVKREPVIEGSIAYLPLSGPHRQHRRSGEPDPRHPVTMIDVEDLPLVQHLQWFSLYVWPKGDIDIGRLTKVPYAATSEGVMTTYLHAMLIKPDDDMRVVHINGDTLDNRRVNLSLVPR